MLQSNRTLLVSLHRFKSILWHCRSCHPFTTGRFVYHPNQNQTPPPPPPADNSSKELQKELKTSANDAIQTNQKVIMGTMMEAVDTTNPRLVALRRMAKKNKFVAILLQRPISIMEFMELPKEEQKKRFIKGSMFNLLAFSGSVLILLLFVYSCVTDHEITERKFLDIIQLEIYDDYEEILVKHLTDTLESKFITSSDAIVKKMDTLIQRIIKANAEYVEADKFDLNWSGSVLDTNQLVLYLINSMQFIIGSKQLVDQCENDDQLAYIIANALAHSLLKHRREWYGDWSKMSNIYNTLKVRLLLNLWGQNESSMFDNKPLFGILAMIDHAVSNFAWRRLKGILEYYNYDAILEDEADRIAYQLLSRACFDIREAKKIATKLANLVDQQSFEEDALKRDENSQKYRYIYKHVYDQQKLSSLENQLDAFLEFRKSCDCPPLD